MPEDNWPSEERPPPKELGPYVVERQIGRGGSGIVYAAREGRSGAAAALKTLDALQPEEQEALRREIYTLSRLEHPGIIRIFRSGVDAGVPWYAMELMRDPTLAERWQQGAPLDESLRLLMRLCQTLAFLHGEGIVHRDLKPENVFLRGGEDPVLADFGFVSRFADEMARERLERGGLIVGTLAYMSPEQIRGEYVDARADLYALGCMLYEAITGAPPFTGHPRELLIQHQEAEVVPPSRLGREAAPELERLCLAMLAKDPRDRPGYAEDVAAALAEAAGTAAVRPARAVRPYFYRPGFAGRRAALEIATRSLEDAERGQGRLLLVSGESGAGKTRFAMEVTREASMRGFQVVTGECAAIASSASGRALGGASLQALTPLLQALGDCCRHEGAAATEELFGTRGRTLAAYEASVAEIPGFEALPRPPPLQAEAARARVVSDLVASVQAFAARAPLLLVIDDLQWADEMTLAALTALATGLAETPVLVIATARSEELTPEILELRAMQHASTLELERLDSGSIGSMVSDMLAMVRPPEELVELLARESEGNPFFVGEYVREAVVAELLHRREGFWQTKPLAPLGRRRSLSLGLPDTLQGLIEARLERLPGEVRPLLESAAVLGREFESDLLRESAHFEDEPYLAGVALLLRGQVLEEAPDGRLRFHHDKLREVAYALVEASSRRALHARAASCIEARHQDSAEYPSFFPQLANHWNVAGDAEKATRFFDLSGERALDAGAYGEAYRFLGRASELDPGARVLPLSRARRERMLSIASFGVGSLDECVAHAESALENLGIPVPRSEARWALVTANELGRRLLRPLAPAREDADPAVTTEAALISCQISTSYFFSGSPLRTLASLLRALRFGERSGEDRAIAEACWRLAFVAGTGRLRGLADRLFLRAHAAAERAGDPRGPGLALYFEAMHYIGLCQWERVQELGGKAAAILEDAGDTHEAEVAHTIAAHGFFYAGELDRADAHLQRVLSSAARRSNGQHVGWGQFGLARSLVLRGDATEALRLAESAHDLICDLPDTLSNVMLEGTLATAALHAGESGKALAACRRLIERLARGEQPATGQCIDGVGAAADVLLSLGERGLEQGSARYEQDLKQALAGLQRFALLFPIAKPAMHRSRARALQLRGKTRKARRAWARSQHAARQLAMPLDEARVHLDLARVSTGNGDAERHREAARILLEEIGCPALAEL